MNLILSLKTSTKTPKLSTFTPIKNTVPEPTASGDYTFLVSECFILLPWIWLEYQGEPFVNFQVENVLLIQLMYHVG